MTFAPSGATAPRAGSASAEAAELRCASRRASDDANAPRPFDDYTILRAIEVEVEQPSDAVRTLRALVFWSLFCAALFSAWWWLPNLLGAFAQEGSR